MNFKNFCSDEFESGGRYDTGEPFVRDGFEYATDSRIIVRVKTDKPDTDSSRHVPEKPHKVFEGAVVNLKTWIPLDIALKIEECKDCHGTGIELRGLEVGDVAEECVTCDGRKTVDLTPSIKVDGALFGPKYLQKIQSLHNVRYCVVGGLKAMQFVFDGGEGRLMPRTE
jgi:hypothetical protein